MNIEMQMAHQTNSNEESIIELFVATLEESSEHEDNTADEVAGKNPAQTFSEDGANVENRTQTKSRPIIRNNASKKKVSKTDGIKFPCHQCDKQYTAKSKLTRHIQSVHEGVKYTCNQCGKQYTKQDSLITHIQSVHEGVKYACNQCDYEATQQSSLTTHIQSKHEGIKYACNRCDYQSSWQHCLTAHIKSKHEGIKYACNQCDQPNNLEERVD